MLHTLFKTLIRLLLVLPLLALVACNGKESAPGEAPQEFMVKAGDGQVTITWKEDPNLTYWVFTAAATGITPDDYGKYPSAQIFPSSRSPMVLTGLANGVTYAFTINATRNGGPAGPAAQSIAVSPRPAGNAWTVGSSAGTVDLNNVVFNNNLGHFLAVGQGGAIQRSIDGKTWTAQTSGTAADLTTVFYDNVDYLALTSDGKLLRSTDGITWAAAPVGTGTTKRLNRLVGGANVYLAVGEAGTIVTSPPDRSAWTAQVSGTQRDLNKVVYTSSGFVAVGAGGTILSSVDGKTWKTQNSGVTADLHGVYFSGANVIAVGKGGTIVSGKNIFTDTPVWTVNESGTTQDLYAVNAASQVVVVGAAGTALTGKLATGADRYTWTLATTGTGSRANDLVLGGATYVAVGVGGSNASAY
ncbi:hypothetical protein FNU76_18225 [Chitinimonas arctica]|uniref:Fibronectin type-III domain-containing protein n=1 Tax=Chitinimonas arctica TaxID=2594795 RepID=A0A516SJ04_9NEIS|nr:hypothetical protein [Chitinimonas arctica]QDQ28127.1 hypothetical protein FNU76_18225 [Chitinimonas arctica]